MGDVAPRGFKVLVAHPELFYKVESDGGVLITGNKTCKTTFNKVITDGSRVQGGINQKGLLFGDRVVNNKGRKRSLPLRWKDLNDLEGLPPPHARRREILPHPFKQPRVVREPSAPAMQEGMQPETSLLLKQFTEDQAQPKAATMKRAVANPNKPPEVRAGYIIDRLKAEMGHKEKLYRELRTKHDQLVQKYNAINGEIHNYRNQVAQIRSTTRAEITKIQAEYEARTKTIRWQLEAVPNRDIRAEGLIARTWEIIDAKQELRYVVIVSVPAGTTDIVQEQWLEDLQASLDTQLGPAAITYVIVPDYSVLSVNQIVPGLDGDGDDDIDQF